MGDSKNSLYKGVNQAHFDSFKTNYIDNGLRGENVGEKSSVGKLVYFDLDDSISNWVNIS